jgi:Ca-activated chloride channel family protein
LIVESGDNRHRLWRRLHFLLARVCEYDEFTAIDQGKFMTVHKPTANLERAPQIKIWLLMLMLLYSNCCFEVSARAPQNASTISTPQQQRPRRVGSTTTQKDQSSDANKTTKPSASAEADESDVVRIETQLISIPAVVTDRTGHPLTNLRADNFLVYEDNRLQRISNFATTEAPFEVALLLDTSGSTRADVALIRRAANAFIDALRTGDRVAVVAFNTARDGDMKGLATVEVLTSLTSDRAQLRKAIESIGASNGTPFYDALIDVADKVFRESPRQEVRGRRAVVALTDGVDSTSDNDFAAARAKLLSADIAAYFIEVNTEDFVEDRLMRDCADDQTLRLSRAQMQRYRKIFAPRADASDYANFCRLGQFERIQISRDLYNLARREMAELARTSGGKTFTAEDLRDARQAFAELAQLIGTQYSLGYYSTNKTHDGRFRSVRVETRNVPTGAQVRAREGYYAPKN